MATRRFLATCLGVLPFALLVACGTLVLPQDTREDTAPDARVIVELEARFAAASRQRGARTAFLEFLAEDSIVLQPGPVWGRATWESSGELPGVLDWSPDWAELAADGVLGFATGSWWLTPAGGGPRIDGRYVTIWRRGASGWAVAFDGGFERPAATTATATAPPARLGVASCESSPEVSPAELQMRDLALSGSADASHGARTFAQLGKGAIVFHPPGIEGLQQSATQRVALDALPRDTQLWPMGAAVAASGDLGYTYGISSPTADAPADASYVHVWCYAGGDWTILLELRTSLAGP